jgi:hypothetical protein
MATQPIGRNVKLFVDKALSQAAISAHLASEARRLRDEAVRSGQASQVYRTFVDGVEGRSEDTAHRVIQYRFSRLVQATGYALGYAKGRSPAASGRYRNAWLALVNGQPWDGQATSITAGATVMIVNPVPYARKIDVGGMRMSVPPGIVEAVRQAVQRAYPGVKAERDLVLLRSGLYLGAPYTLKGRSKSRRKDRAAGQQLTYPALILSER